MKLSTIREAMRAQFGDRNYRITANGEVHYFGVRCWHLFGYIGERDLERRINEIIEGRRAA
jgi:hypothetical protein